MTDRPAWAKTYLPVIVGAAAALTLGAFVSSIGVVGLAVIWMGIALTVVGVYAYGWKHDALSAKKERDELAMKVGERDTRTEPPATSDERRMKDLQGQLKRAKDEAEAWKRTTEEQKEARLKAEREMEESKKKPAQRAKPALELRGEVILATDLVSTPDHTGDFVSKRLKRGMVIDILAESSAWFTLHVFDSENFRRFTESRRNTDYFISKRNVSSYKERVTIPRGDDWFFVVEPAEGNDTADVRLTIALVGEE